jgi:hypothetical protein
VSRQQDRYPDLYQFLGGCLHQDFDLDHSDADAAVQDAIRSVSGEQLRLIGQQLDEALADLDDEEQAEEFVRRMCDYYPPGDGRSFLGWLRLVQQKVLAARP